MLNLRAPQNAAVQQRGSGQHAAAAGQRVLAPALLPRVSTSRPGYAASRWVIVSGGHHSPPIHNNLANPTGGGKGGPLMSMWGSFVP
eukprot:1147891-Pelagomonas_calceolata.AAC.4